MRYENMVSGRFVSRPNRFIAHVEIDGQVQVCHVKNTGRCRELLPPGAKVWCQQVQNPHRKTKFDLIAAEKGQRLINMDSQAPNAAAKQWLQEGGLGALSQLRWEVFYGRSRFDFAFVKDGKPCYLEVKGVTLEHNGVCAFPDAPTQRGTRHLQELVRAVEEGYGGYVLFVIQMENVTCMHPNEETDPQFAAALRAAASAGVQILAVDCKVTPDAMQIHAFVPVKL